MVVLTVEQSQGADDLRFLCRGVVIGQAQPVLLSQCHDYLGELTVIHAASQLSVQRIDRRLPQGVAVDVIDGLVQRVNVE